MTPHPILAVIFLLAALGSGSAAAVDAPEFHLNVQHDWIEVDDIGHAAGDFDVEGFRRIRASMDWQLSERIELKLEHDFESQAWTDAHLRIDAGPGTLLVGQFKQPFSLETMYSNRNRLLMESAYNSTFGIDRRVGIGYQWQAGQVGLGVGLYGQNLTGANAGEGAAARATWAPISDAERTLHLGLGAGLERRDSNSLSLSTRPETGLGSLRLARTGTLTGVDDIARLGLEAAWRNGPLLVQGELGRLSAERVDAEDLQADGAYVTAAWLFTGETHPYKQGVFVAPKPEHRWGALEGVARISRIDFDGGSAPTDGQEALTLGVNWYLTERTRVMVNHVRASQRGTPAAGSELLDPRITELRLQVGF